MCAYVCMFFFLHIVYNIEKLLWKDGEKLELLPWHEKQGVGYITVKIKAEVGIGVKREMVCKKCIGFSAYKGGRRIYANG